MAQTLTIRQIDPKLHDALRQRAARSKRSMEAEVRTILAENCLPPSKTDWAKDLRQRAQSRTGPRPQSDSADLIRQGRDER